MKVNRIFFVLGFFLLVVAFPAQGVQPTALAAPVQAGMEAAGDRVFLDPELDSQLRAKIPSLVERSKARVSELYGTLEAKPNLVFCASTECFRKFGGIGLGFTDGSHIVISPQGFYEAVVAHELAHVELALRLGGFNRTLEKVPQWFDEGQAVMVSRAPEFSETAWRTATHDGKDAPDLSALASVEEWNRLTGWRGEHMQYTYGTARHEVARWFAKSGRAGFMELLEALDRNEDFYLAYHRIEQQFSPALAERN